MNFSIILFKDSNCDLCKVMQQELMDNPPNADITILHVKHNYTKDIAYEENITEFPTIIIYNGKKEISRHTGFIDCEIINKILKNYETKSMV